MIYISWIYFITISIALNSWNLQSIINVYWKAVLFTFNALIFYTQIFSFDVFAQENCWWSLSLNCFRSSTLLYILQTDHIITDEQIDRKSRKKTFESIDLYYALISLQCNQPFLLQKMSRLFEMNIYSTNIDGHQYSSRWYIWIIHSTDFSFTKYIVWTHCYSIIWPLSVTIDLSLSHHPQSSCSHSMSPQTYLWNLLNFLLQHQSIQ